MLRRQIRRHGDMSLFVQRSLDEVDLCSVEIGRFHRKKVLSTTKATQAVMPVSLRRKLQEIAPERGCSMNQLREFCGHNPISSGVQVGTGGKRGPSTGVRVSAKRRKCPFSFDSRAGQAWLGRVAVSGSTPRVLGWLSGDAKRRTWSTTLDRLRLRCPDLQCAAFVLLASWWASQSDEDGDLGQAVADASGFKACSFRMEIAQPLHPTRGLPLPIAPIQGKEAPGFGVGSQASHSAGVRKDRHHGSWLAHVSPLCRLDISEADSQQAGAQLGGLENWH